MATFNFDRSRLVMEGVTPGNEQLWFYTHDNGYRQCYAADVDFGDTVEDFIDLLKRGGNDLYKAYSMLPAELINSDGDPEVEFDFDDARVYIETGKFPSAQKLQQNEATKGQLKFDTSKL